MKPSLFSLGDNWSVCGCRMTGITKTVCENSALEAVLMV